jgi:hypothetical protein
MVEPVNSAGFTISPKTNLHEALVVAESFLKNHSAHDYWIFLTDIPALNSLPSADPRIRFADASFLEPKTWAEMAARYTDLEFAYAITPFVFLNLFTRGYSKLLFLKLETLVLASVDELFDDLSNHPVIATPHLIQPQRSMSSLARELGVLGAGIFNGGVLGFAKVEESIHFLNWWSSKTEFNCVREVSEGLHFEQRWLDFLICFAPNLKIVRDAAINVAHWNLHERELNLRDGQLFVDGRICRIFRFSGFEEKNPDYLSRYRLDLSTNNLGAVGEILFQYRSALAQQKLLLQKAGLASL